MTRRYCEECGSALQPDEIAESLTGLGVLLCSRCLDDEDGKGSCLRSPAR